MLGRRTKNKEPKFTHLIISIILLLILILVVVAGNRTSHYPIDWSLVPEKPAKQPNEQTETFANCVCKRYFNQCTPNCCCDPDCTSVKLFTQCNMQKSRNIEDYRCVPQQVVVFKNLPSNIKVKSWNQMSTTTPLFCVYYDSSSVKGTFYESLPDFTENDIKKAIENDKRRYYRRTIQFADVYDKTITPDISSSYMYGSFITVADKIVSGVKARPQNRLSIPSAIFSDQCEDMVAARFLHNIPKTNVCYRLVGNLASDCSTFLSTSPWTGGLYVSKRPGDSSTSTSDYVTINVRRVEKRNLGTSVPLGSLPTTQYVGSNCLNALQSIQFYVSYSPDGTIQAIDSDIVIEDITSGMVPTLYQMAYGITFLNGTQVSSLDTGLVRENSGNPGYLQSSPIIAGVLTMNDEKTKKAVLQNIRGLQFYSGLTCDGAEMQSITFMEDVVTACRLQLSLSDLAALCASNEPLSITAIESSADMIGRFGNADSNNVNDWVQITAQDTTVSAATWDSNTQTCYNLASGLQYDFVIAKSSSKQNEQWKVSGVKRNRIAQNWKFTARNPADKQSFWIQFRAQFITLSSQDTVVRVAKAPNLLPTLPEDIFYPFSLFSNSHALQPSIGFTIWMIIGVIFFVHLQLV